MVHQNSRPCLGNATPLQGPTRKILPLLSVRVTISILTHCHSNVYFNMSDIDERPAKKMRLDPTTEDPTEPNTELLKEQSNPANELSEDHKADRRAKPQLQIPNPDGLSKTQLKKLRKKQEWEAGKDYRKVKRREKNKEKQSRKASERAELSAKIATGEIEAESVPTKPVYRYPRPIQTPLSLILDCDFNELMTEKELISLGSQLTRCYSDNKVTPFRAHLAISSWGGSLKNRFETVLTNNQLGWKGVKFFEEDFEAAAKELDRVMRSEEGGKLAGVFAPPGIDPLTGNPFKNPKNESAPSTESDTPAQTATETTEDGISSRISPVPTSSTPAQPIVTGPEVIPNNSETDLNAPPPQLVYLSSDSENTLERLSPYTSYIIGGIVDKNRHKGLCYKRACERGIPTAKLPIGQYLSMTSRSVLAVNHVVEIMLKWMETGDWGKAFLSVMPKRKGAKLKNKKGKVSDEQDEGEEDAEHDEMGEDYGSEGENAEIDIE